MMFGSPFFSDFDDGYYVHRPRSSYQEQKRRAQEEARRRAELERYYRMKDLQEQEELRRRQEYARRLRQQQLMEDQEAYGEGRCRGRALQAEEERQDRLRAQRYLRGDSPDEDYYDEGYSEETEAPDSRNEEPVYRRLRGPDGRIYRVQVGTTEKPKVAKHHSVMDDKENQGRRKVEGRKTVPIRTSKETVPIRTTEERLPMAIDTRVARENDVQHSSTTMRSNEASGKKKKKGKKRVTIIVEDASDSETGDEYSSPWRNRRPSPGQWMEPIEGIDDKNIV